MMPLKTYKLHRINFSSPDSLIDFSSVKKGQLKLMERKTIKSNNENYKEK